MYLSKIHLFQYKNHKDQTFELCKGFNCFIGKNGVGKTNVLDAVYYLCYTKSYFSRQDLATIMQGEKQCVVTGNLVNDKEEQKLVCGNQIGAKKTVSSNGVKFKTLTDYLGLVNAVFISPTDILLIYESAEVRRRFLDAMISSVDKNYLQSLVSYKGYLEQKNKALKIGKERNQYDDDLLETYNAKLNAYAVEIYNKRVSFLSSFENEFKSIYQSFGGEEVELKYVSNLNDQDLNNYYHRNLAIDKHAGRTVHGVHRDDIAFTISEKPLKQYGSQGQIKSFLIALKLAKFALIKKVTGAPPLLLLDDIFEKIDDERTKKLLYFVRDSGFEQIFVTDAHPDRCNHYLDLVQQFTWHYNLKLK